MKGALPPSSRLSFLIVGAHCAISTRPVSVEPVNERWRTTSLSHSTLPTSEERSVGTTLRTPAGRPARCVSSARASAHSGVCPGGFTTTVQPAASAGATLRVIIATGKFHGVIAAQTPIGCLSTSTRLFASVDGIVSP